MQDGVLYVAFISNNFPLFAAACNQNRAAEKSFETRSYLNRAVNSMAIKTALFFKEFVPL